MSSGIGVTIPDDVHLRNVIHFSADFSSLEEGLRGQEQKGKRSVRNA